MACPSASDPSEPLDASVRADAEPDSSSPDASVQLDAGVVVLSIRDDEGRSVESLPYAAPFHAHVAGLAPAQEVTLRARLWGFESHAAFIADDAGTVDLARDAPVEGTYDGVDPDGMVWSMERLNDDVGQDYGIDFAVEVEAVEVARARIDRRPMGDDAAWSQVRDDGLYGTLVVPPGDGPHPVVVVLGGSEGGIRAAEFNAGYISTLGYAALALAYFGVPGLPDGLTDIPLEYFTAAFDWIERQPALDPERLALLGGSRGGELVLILGAMDPRVLAVIGTVPSGLRWGSGSDADRAAWTLGGEVLPYVATEVDVLPVRETLPNGDYAYRDTPVFDAILAATSAEDLEAATIEIDRTTGPVLLFGASDDGIWPSCTLADFAYQRLVDSGHAEAQGDESVCLPQAGHLVGIPGWPTLDSYALERGAGQRSVMGGTPEGNGRAGRVFDRRVRALLERVFGE